MKKLMKFLGITLLSILALVFIILAGLSIKYSPRYIYRLARFNVADVYDYKFLSHNIGTNIWDARGDRLSIDYRYTRLSDEIIANKAHSILADFQVKITDRLKVSSLYEYNFLDNTRVQLGFGFNYKADCWAIDGRVLDKTNLDNTSDLSYEFKIQLFGLGEFGI